MLAAGQKRHGTIRTDLKSATSGTTSFTSKENGIGVSPFLIAATGGTH
jgi:hypothetical protein